MRDREAWAPRRPDGSGNPGRAAHDHVLSAYGDEGSYVYPLRTLPAGGTRAGDVASRAGCRLSDAVVEWIRVDPKFAARMLAELGASGSRR